jgi:hypothetical protein
VVRNAWSKPAVLQRAFAVSCRALEEYHWDTAAPTTVAPPTPTETCSGIAKYSEALSAPPPPKAKVAVMALHLRTALEY